MKILIAHQNCPGQYKHLAAALARDPSNEIVFISQRKGYPYADGKLLTYEPPRSITPGIHAYLAETEAGVLNGQQVVRELYPLKQAGFVPDLMLGHNGWGEIWYLKDLFPDCPLIGYFEYFYQSQGADIGFDPEDPPSMDLLLKIRTKNLGNLLGLSVADAGQCPTYWQQSLYPTLYHDKLRVIHEGIDTDTLRPNPEARLIIEGTGLTLCAGDEVLTYVASNLEPCRGFTVFMRSLPAILAARPQARVVIVGGDRVFYGQHPTQGGTWREAMCTELGDSLDWSRVHFLGVIPYDAFRVLMQVSRVHIYLTQPFVLSWSMLEAMACGACLIASRTAPVQEVVVDGENGILVDYFDVKALASAVVDALENPGAYTYIRERARQTIVERYDLNRICLPAQLRMLNEVREGHHKAGPRALTMPETGVSPSVDAARSVEALIAAAPGCFDRQDYTEALTLGQQILELEPAHETGIHVTGLAHLRLGEAAQALPLLEKTLQHKPNNGLVHFQLAQALLATGHPSRALVYFDSAQALGVVDAQLEQLRDDAAGQAFQHHCDWLNYDRVQRLVRQSVVSTGRWVVGESTLASPYFGNAQLLRATRNHARNVMAGVPAGTGAQTFQFTRPGAKIRMGFVGCDFFEQATAYLMIGFIEALDRQQFDVIAYDHGGSRPDTPFRQRIHAGYDQVIDITELTDEQAAQRIHDDHIDILFSIKNPASARLGIFARRPAPIQVHYLYYPGTSGMPFFDFIVADDVVIPPGAESGYSEQVLRLPGCYQPNDNRRVRAQDRARSDWGLPEDAVILGNFSQTYKYTPSVYDLWCQLLSRDGKRILWLLCEDPKEQAKLRAEAQARGIEQGRIFFTGKLVTQAHLDRLRHVDLVVDTYPYGGHTLTSDALWAGTPVLTLCGETFASRVAASLLQDVGMGELVAHNEQEYLDKGEALLGSANARQQWRSYLDQGRDGFALFDPTAYARKFESAIAGLVERHWS